jgi:hypothetical protein
MVSSTFYDLSQVRTDLLHFLRDEVGYRPLLSEYPSFPIDPDADTIENCRRRVERDADILVLIIGGRYGYVDAASDKSVTNLEYLAARAKGIPIYAFVDKRVTAILPVWKANPEGDFSTAVDDVRLFEFVEQVRSVDRIWTNEFERAQDIIAALRTQFAHLTLQGLEWRMQLRGQSLAALKGLEGEALRMALERPEGWEFRLFGQVLSDEIEANANLRREHQLRVLLGPSEHVPPGSTGQWMTSQTHDLGNIAESFDTLINVGLEHATGPPGTPGDAREIVFVARQIAAVHRHAIEWSQRVRRAHVEERFRPVINEMAAFTDDIVENIETHIPDFLRQIEEAAAASKDGEPQVIKGTLVIDVSNVDRFQQEINRLK